MRLRFFVYRAAAVLITGLLATGIWLSQNRSEPDLRAALPAEIQETLAYYENMSQSKLYRLKNLPNGYQETLSEIESDLKEYDKEQHRLLEEWKKYPEDSRIIHALIENERMKAEMLNYLFTQLAIRTDGDVLLNGLN